MFFLFPRESFLQLVSLQRLDWGRDGLHFHDSPEDGNQGKQPVNLRSLLYSKPETKNTKICIYVHIHTSICLKLDDLEDWHVRKSFSSWCVILGKVDIAPSPTMESEIKSSLHGLPFLQRTVRTRKNAFVPKIFQSSFFRFGLFFPRVDSEKLRFPQT